LNIPNPVPMPKTNTAPPNFNFKHRHSLKTNPQKFSSNAVPTVRRGTQDFPRRSSAVLMRWYSCTPSIGTKCVLPEQQARMKPTAVTEMKSVSDQLFALAGLDRLRESHLTPMLHLALHDLQNQQPLETLRSRPTIRHPVQSSFSPKIKPEKPKNRPQITSLHSGVRNARERRESISAQLPNLQTIPFFEQNHEDCDIDEELDHFFRKGTAVQRGTMKKGSETILWKPNALKNITLPVIEDGDF
jgi:hypothetical protein